MMSRELKLFTISFMVVWVISVALWTPMEKGEELYLLLDWRTEILDQAMFWITKLSEEWMYITLGIIFLFINMRNSLLIGTTGLLSMGLTSPLKTYFNLPRPRVWLSVRHELEAFEGIAGNYIHDGFNSFPSGHTLSAFMLAVICTRLFPKGWALWLILAMLVGFSRIYLVQHFFEDILFGSILGVLFSLAFLALIKDRWPGLERPLIKIPQLSGKGDSQ